MSELTPCNFCTLNRIKQRAKKEGQKVITQPGGLGTIVYVYPKEIRSPWKYGEKYIVAELMEITDHCVC